jgi:membrane-associated phospholipid phosphatase
MAKDASNSGESPDHDRPDQHDPGPAPALAQPNASRRLLLLGGTVGALLLALGIRSVTGRSGGGAPALLFLESTSVVELAAPAAPGSGAEAAEVQELLSFQSKRGKTETEEATFWQKGAVLRWNEIAVGQVALRATSPVVASRLFALVSLAQHDALVVVLQQQRIHKRPAPAGVTPLFAVPAESSYPSAEAAVAAASAAVLGYVYNAKEDVERIEKRSRDHQESRLWAGVSRRSDLTAGEQIGRAVAERLIARAKTDGAAETGPNWRGDVPAGKDKWQSSEHPATAPVRPFWGKVRPWLLKTPDQFRPPPPPAIDSPEFAKALDEVRQVSRTRTPEQLKIAQFWGDAQGSPTPAGHWNNAAAELIAKQPATAGTPSGSPVTTGSPVGGPSSELAAARVMAILNMAVMDAGIGCWDAKYHYWYLRPIQADPTLTLPVGLPNFPSYPSGHSCFSGAAAEVLGYFFPAEKERMTAMATEASMSRVYGGIHYRFEGEQGLALGRSVGKLAVDTARIKGIK